MNQETAELLSKMDIKRLDLLSEVIKNPIKALAALNLLLTRPMPEDQRQRYSDVRKALEAYISDL